MHELTDPLPALGLSPWADPDPGTLRGLIPETLIERLYQAYSKTDRAALGEALLGLADCQLRSYRYDLALMWLVRARGYAAGDAASIAFERIAANIARRLGNGDAAASAAGAAYQLAQDAGLTREAAEALSLRGAVHAVAGNWKASEEDLRDAVKLFQRQKNRFGEAEAAFRDADRLFRMDDRYRALERVDQAVAKIGDGGTPSLVAKGVYLRGRCRLALGDAKKALSDLDFGRDLALRQESRELHWHCESARAEALEHLRLRSEASEAVEAARSRMEGLALALGQVPVRERFLARPDVAAFLKRLKARASS